MNAVGVEEASLPAGLEPPVDEALRTEIVRRIASHLPECCIVLFGSQVYGVPRADSDIDLLVVAETRTEELTVAGELYGVLHPRSVSLDIVVMTPETYRRRRGGFDPLLEDVATKGCVLYGKLPRL